MLRWLAAGSSTTLERNLCVQARQGSRALSALPPKKKEDASSSSQDEPKKQPQPFPTSQLMPGEWDVNRTDPYFRPQPPKHSRLISAEDFANRPPVGFDGEFSSYQDAMINLSWMDEQTCKSIYHSYVQMMMASQDKHQTTSHEYVTRVIAQRFNITTTRAAGVIQLQHAEEQMRQHNPELLCDEQAKYAEEIIQQNIRDAYRAERQSGPRGGDDRRGTSFLEDPVGIHGRGEPDETSTQWAEADDVYDMEHKLKQANVRDAERARLLIDGHIFKKDTDESEEFVKTDGSCHRLIQAKKKQAEASTQNSTSIPYPETNSKGEKRERWKFVAKVVNTRSQKKKGRRLSGYTNDNISNTLVEHNGELRVATVAEAKETAWKTTRTRSNAYLYEGAKEAWLEKTLRGKSNVWGEAPKTKASDVTAAAAKKGNAKTDEKTKEEGAEASASATVEETESVESKEATESSAKEESIQADDDESKKEEEEPKSPEEEVEKEDK